MSSNSLGLSVEQIKKEDGVRGFDYSTIIVDDLISSTDTVKIINIIDIMIRIGKAKVREERE